MLGPKGLAGGLRVELLTDWPDALAPGVELWEEGAGDEATWRIVRAERGGRVPVLHLSDVTSREAAEGLVGRYLEGRPRALEPGEYFWDDLIGLRVESAAGEPLGELVEIFRAGGNEVYRIVGPDGERLVPALHSAIGRIDLEAQVMVLTDDEPEEVR